MVVSSSQNSLSEARLVLDLAAKMRTGYNEIVDSIRGIHQEVEQIAATSEETAASAEEISAATEEQTAAVSEVSSNAQVLSARTTKLKKELERFQL
jgi:methyl-accepting chemotaxis protein